MTTHDADLDAATRASAADIGRSRGTWTQWGPRRRRLAALSIAAWFAFGAVVAVAVALDDLVVLLIAASGAFAAKIWLSSRLHDAEHAENAFDADGSAPVLLDEAEFEEELDEAELESERTATILGVMKVLEEDPVAMRYVYPTRERLVARSVSNAIEWIGIAIAVVAAPDTTGMAAGFMLMVLGGSSGFEVTGLVLGQRLYRTAVSDRTRTRWLRLEERLTIATVGLLVVVAILRGTFI